MLAGSVLTFCLDKYSRFNHMITEQQAWYAGIGLLTIFYLALRLSWKGDFIRVRRQYLVNLSHICRLMKGEGRYLLLTGDITVRVARNQKDRLLERFSWL